MTMTALSIVKLYAEDFLALINYYFHGLLVLIPFAG